MKKFVTNVTNFFINCVQNVKFVYFAQTKTVEQITLIVYYDFGSFF